MAIPGQGKRIQQLVLELSAKLGRRVTLAEFGEMVGKSEKGRHRPYSKSGVSEWIQERTEPSLSAFLAMQAVSAKHTPPGRSFEWIALGKDGDDELPMLPAVVSQTEAEKSAKKPSRRRRPA